MAQNSFPTSAEAKRIARAAVKIAMSENRAEELEIKEELKSKGIMAAAVDFGGDFLSSIGKIVERAVVASRREGLIDDDYHLEAALAGATREAIAVISDKSIGLSVGGKIGIARTETKIAVCLFFGVGILHIDEVVIGFANRAI